MDTYLENLNDEQRMAVTHIGGPQLIIAGAGSGKTRVLTYRIAWLLNQGVAPYNILALTFTNKAAREMQERIAQQVGEQIARYLYMGTFHSIATRILRREAESIGYTRDFTIYDTTDSKSLIKQIVRDLQLEDKVYKPATVLSRISTAKEQLMTASDYAGNKNFQKSDAFNRMYHMHAVYEQYEARLRASNAMDFDDLLMQLCFLLRNNTEVRTRLQTQFKHVLVDEYQDTNHAQYILIKTLAAPENNICVVGDDAQSIYSFRGADIRNILSFQNDYQNAQLYKLERNYRSTQNIVNAANSLIYNNREQIHKQVYSKKDEGERLQVCRFMSDREEADGIASLIDKDLGNSGHVSPEDIAILYRTNAQSRAFENAFRKAGINYRIYGGVSFYQRKEIKDAVCYFRLAVNSRDDEALLRVINTPARGIGDTTVRKVILAARTNGVSLLQAAAAAKEFGADISAATERKLHNFVSMIASFEEQTQKLSAYDFADMVLRQSGLMQDAMMDTSAEGQDRKQNLDELLSGMHEFEERQREQGNEQTPITDFLSEVSLLTDQDERLDDPTPRVTLMTIHAAKGLEFPIVYIVGLENNLFPHSLDAHEIEEERRLLYVAITRAEQRCVLSYAMQRFRNGQIEMTSPSCFLREIDARYIQQATASKRFEPANRTAFFEQKTFSRNTYNQSYNTKKASSVRTNDCSEPQKTADEAVLGQWPYTKGDRIYHKSFGYGTVQRLFRLNESDRIEILFDNNKQSKTLLLAYAKLDKL